MKAFEGSNPSISAISCVILLDIFMSRKIRISKDEIVADSIFLAIAALVTFLLIFFFDIHHSFYKWPFELKFIFHNIKPYIVFMIIGTSVGFLLIKALLYAFEREEHLR